MTIAHIDRAALRRDLRARRKAFVAALSPAERNLAFRVLPSPVMKLIAPGSRIALYEPTGDEAPTGALAWFLHERGFPLALPRLSFDDPDAVEFAAWSPENILVPGPRRIPQPAPYAASVTPDVVFAPLLGFDPALNRMGQGAGHYDRVFARLPDALRIGLAWSVQMVDALAVESWDVPLHMIITEQRIFARE